MDEKVWAGIDAGKELHWAHVLDASGQQVLSRRVENDEADLSGLIDETRALSEVAVWALDQPGGSAALLLALLWEREQRVLYLPGLAVDRARDAYPGESNTDARDAYLIAEQARMRSNLAGLVPEEGDLAELQLLLARRRDLVADRTRSINRLRDVLLSLFPALASALGERTLEMSAKGALMLVRHYQSPSAIRRVGHRRLAAVLKNRGVQGAEDIARKAITAAKAQSVALPAENVAATICAELAEETLVLKESIDNLDRELGQRFFARPEARILSSLPGMGPILGSEFLVSVGDLSAFESADQLAAFAGLVPAAHDSGKRIGNHRRMRGGNKILKKRVFYQSAFASLRSSPHSRAFYDRKRREGKKHTQALIALARRRVNVLWAMLRDKTTFEVPPAA
jgi:transposase